MNWMNEWMVGMDNFIFVANTGCFFEIKPTHHQCNCSRCFHYSLSWQDNFEWFFLWLVKNFIYSYIFHGLKSGKRLNSVENFYFKSKIFNKILFCSESTTSTDNDDLGIIIDSVLLIWWFWWWNNVDFDVNVVVVDDVDDDKRKRLSCVRSCFLKWSFLPKRLSHQQHWYGRIPECIRRCLVNSSFLVNDFWQLL